MKLLVLPGDGIGPEIMSVTRAAMGALAQRFSLGYDLVEREIGLNAHARTGSTLPDDILEEIRAADGALLGPVSTEDYPPAAEGGVNPSGTIRKSLDLYANIRPSRSRPGVPAMAAEMDLVVVRENTEGFYADRNMFQGSGEFMPTPDLALSVRKITRQGSTRIARVAFDLAMTRRKQVAVVHKANVLKVSDGLFLDAVRTVAKDYPNVEVTELLIDAMAAHLVRTPGRFDVIVTTNMYGDILSDEAAELSGGLGLGASVNVGDDHGIAQAAHGSAPDIAGTNTANPTASLLSAAMLLDWLALRHRDNALAVAAAHLESAVGGVLAEAANHTPDLGGTATTEVFGAAVISAIVSREATNDR